MSNGECRSIISKMDDECDHYAVYEHGGVLSYYMLNAKMST
jgi:hypothetical protein